MALTAENEQRLSAAKLIDFFDQNRAEFAALATAAYGYVSGYVKSAGLPVRMDDVASALELALRVSDKLETFLATRRLPQKYWYRYFADLVVDRLWAELTRHE